MAKVSSYYKAKRAANLANPTSASVFVQNDASTKAVFVPLAVDAGATSARFLVKIRGRATTGTTSNFLAKLQYTSDVTATAAATAGNNTDVVTLTNRSLATITRPWSMDIELIWDSTSQRLSGTFLNGFNSETLETVAAITALTGIDLTTRKTGIVAAAIFGTGNASNVATIDDFSVEVS